MLIDWFTVAAQTVNFLVLVWLLKRFLYAPILLAIDAREKRIADEKTAAQEQLREAKQQRKALEHEKLQFDSQREKLLDQAASEAALERSRLLDAARAESDALRKKRQDALNAEYDNLFEEISQRTRSQAFSLARRTLAGLANEDLDLRIAQAFMLRIKDAGIAFEPNVLVRSAFALNDGMRQAIEAAIADAAGSKVEVRFETSPGLIAGIELAMQGRKIAWSASDYLGSLEKEVGELIKARRSEHG